MMIGILFAQVELATSKIFDVQLLLDFRLMLFTIAVMNPVVLYSLIPIFPRFQYLFW